MLPSNQIKRTIDEICMRCYHKNRKVDFEMLREQAWRWGHSAVEEQVLCMQKVLWTISGISS